MVGFLLMSHGELAKGILSTANCILDVQEKTEVLTLDIDDDIGEFESAMREKLEALNDGDGVLVMVDLMGGSPCNKASLMLRDGSVELVTGLNFPMFSAACEARAEGKNLQEILEDCLQFGRDGIISMREFYRSRGMNL